jgi:hypothetical protein
MLIERTWEREGASELGEPITELIKAWKMRPPKTNTTHTRQERPNDTAKQVETRREMDKRLQQGDLANGAERRVSCQITTGEN